MASQTILPLLLSGLFSSLVTAQTPENGGTPVTPDNAPSPSPTGPGDAVAGASGSGGGINISKGGLVAIILVVAIVAILGIVSAVLFYLAKKRQWELRKSIRRTARRFTSRQSSMPTARSGASRKETGSKSTTSAPVAKPKSKVAMVDLEKGSPQTNSSVDSSPRSPQKWRQNMFGKKGGQ